MTTIKTTKVTYHPNPAEVNTLTSGENLAALIFKHQHTAIKAIVGILENENADAGLKLKAATIMLDMGDKVYERLNSRRRSMNSIFEGSDTDPELDKVGMGKKSIDNVLAGYWQVDGDEGA